MLAMPLFVDSLLVSSIRTTLHRSLDSQPREHSIQTKVYYFWLYVPVMAINAPVTLGKRSDSQVFFPSLCLTHHTEIESILAIVNILHSLFCNECFIFPLDCIRNCNSEDLHYFKLFVHASSVLRIPWNLERSQCQYASPISPLSDFIPSFSSNLSFFSLDSIPRPISPFSMENPRQSFCACGISFPSLSTSPSRSRLIA